MVRAGAGEDVGGGEGSRESAKLRLALGWNFLATDLSLPLRSLRKQRVHDFGAASKICSFQPLKSRSEIDQSAPGSKVKHSKGACYG
jgi:hypothetical protein